MPGIGIGIGMGMGVGRPQASLFDLVRQALFGSGEQGIYMPSVHESFVRGDLFQDAIGTTPVTAAGQPVGLWLDRSGNDNHASQSTAAARPTLQQDANGIYVLRFDGVDDGMVTAPIPGGVGASLLVGMRDDGTVDAWANVVSWGLGADTAPFVGIGRAWVTEDATTRVDSEDYPGPGYNITSQLAGGFDGSSHVISASYGEARRVCIDREIAADTVMPEPLDMTGFDGSIIIGGVHTGYAGNASMGIYGLIVCGAEKSPAQIEQAENLINKYTRAF